MRGFGQELSREQGGAITWLVNDRLGSVRAEFGASGGPSASYNYEPFGKPQGASQPSDYGFTGEPQSAALGLVHLRARWYSPGNGRFLSQDPFPGVTTRPQSLHRFAYAENSPTAWIDPTGKCIAVGGSLPWLVVLPHGRILLVATCCLKMDRLRLTLGASVWPIRQAVTGKTRSATDVSPWHRRDADVASRIRLFPG